MAPRSTAQVHLPLTVVIYSSRLTMEANYLAPTVAYATFVSGRRPAAPLDLMSACLILRLVVPTDYPFKLPVLSTTSRAPTILLMASVASLIPAPTRALYASTKVSRPGKCC